MTLIVYALTDRVIPLARLRGIEHEPLRAVTVGKVTAVIGSVRRRPEATNGRLQQYAEVVRTLASRAPAILPARYATTMTVVTEVEHVLRARQQHLVRALRQVRGRAQMTVRVVSGPGVQKAARSHPQPAPRQDGASYLRARAAEAARLQHVPGFDRVRERVQRFIRDERIEKRGTIATIYHLIPRGSAASYQRALDIGIRDSGLRLIVSGPFPPYAFAEP